MLRAALRTFGPPVAAFFLGRAVLVAAAIHAGVGWPGTGDFTQGDSHNYLSIAQHGYSVYYCATDCPPGLPPGWWGNTAWFPLYPLLIAPFAQLGVPAAGTGVVLSAVFEIAALTVLWTRFARPRGATVGALVLATAALFPGAVYLHAVFPVSLLALLLFAGIDLLGRERWVAGGLVAALAAVTYPPGAVLFVCGAAWALCLPGTPRARAARAAWVAVPATVALLAFWLEQRVQTGYWDASQKLQDHYGRGIHDPTRILRQAKIETLSFLHDPGRTDLVPSVQNLVVAGLVLAGVAGWALSRRREDTLVAAYVVAAWLFILTVGGVGTYRTEIALIPVVILTRRLPVVVQTLLLALVVLPAFLIATLFFQSRLE